MAVWCRKWPPKKGAVIRGRSDPTVRWVVKGPSTCKIGGEAVEVRGLVDRTKKTHIHEQDFGTIYEWSREE